MAWLLRSALVVAAATGAGCDGFTFLEDPEGRARDQPGEAPAATAPPVPRPRVPIAADAAWDPATTHAVIVGVLTFADPAIATFPARNRKDQELADTLIARGVP